MVSTHQQAPAVQLLYAANAKSQNKAHPKQQLYFLIRVENYAYSKQVDIIWTDSNGQRHCLPARYHSMSSGRGEYWNASASLSTAKLDAAQQNLHFSVRYRVNGEEFWDNNHGRKHFLPLGAAMQRPGTPDILNIGFQSRLHHGQQALKIRVASAARVQMVSVHWTLDNWKTVHLTPCRPQAYLTLESGKQLVEGGSQIWGCNLHLGDAYRLQYCFCYETEDGIVWDNNQQKDYVTSRKPLNVLVLNLHCRQEDNQDYKFTQISKAIEELQADVVCLQEVSENWNDAKGDWPSNSARIINERLKQPYHVHADWSHLGFDRYREGLAILSRYPFEQYDSRFLSHCRDPYKISTRKGVMGKVKVPYFGAIRFYSVHTSWWADGFEHQFYKLHEWEANHADQDVKGTLICGDFNTEAGSIGYERILDTQHYDDEFLAVTSPQVFNKVFRQRERNWQQHLQHDGRIDYVFRTRNSQLRATSARFLFNAREYGRVSDHEGLFVSFEPA